MTRTTTAIVATLVFAAVLAFVFRVSASMEDFEVYWRGAIRAAAAEPLYRAEDGHFQFKYLPAFAVLLIPFGAMPLSVAKAVWFFASLALGAALVASSVALVGERRRSAWVLGGAVLLVLGKFLARELTLGQANLLFAVAASSALLAMRTNREAVAGGLAALTLAVKPYGLLLVPWILARRRGGSIAALGAGSVAVALLPLPLYGIDGTLALYRDWWSTVTESTPANLANPDNVSFASLFWKWFGDGRVAPALATATSVCAIAAAVWVFARRQGTRFPELLEGGLLLLLVPLLSPQGWDYVLLVAAPAVVVLANFLDQLPRPMRMTTAAAALVMGLSLFDLMGRDAYGAFMGMGVITLCASMLFVALCTLRARGVA